MLVRQTVLRAALAACALLCAWPAHSLASNREESILMDDNQLIYASPQHMASTLKEIKALGVDRVKVTVVWSLIAPDSSSRHKPNFDATNPAAYPYGAWRRWDQLVAWCRLLGLKVYFQIGPPAPLWATSGPPEKPPHGYAFSENPNAAAFGQFVKAVGRRYSGNFRPESEAWLVPPQQLGVPGRDGITPTASDPNPPVQRVDYWGLWNEPNVETWLTPQVKKVGRHREVDTSPSMYRRLVDTSYAALTNTGHKSDTILVGELASHGKVYPVPFTQELYCVTPSYRPLTGKAATDIGCPKSGNRSKFVAAHPGLFAFPGFAYHPYEAGAAPDKPLPNPNVIVLANLGKMETAIDRSQKAYHRYRHVGMYLTEWGYKTNPPNPFVRVSLQEQATWLNEGEYETANMPRVTSLAQFLLVDNAPRVGATPGTPSYWSTYQTGLIFTNGKAKPGLAAFRIPIWIPQPKHGAHVTVWGELRPADHTKLQTGTLQFKAKGSRSWSKLQTVKTRSSEGIFLVKVKIPKAGQVKLGWADPANGKTFYSRVVTIS
jgi:hypothetical protein